MLQVNETLFMHFYSLAKKVKLDGKKVKLGGKKVKLGGKKVKLGGKTIGHIIVRLSIM